MISIRLFDYKDLQAISSNLPVCFHTLLHNSMPLSFFYKKQSVFHIAILSDFCYNRKKERRIQKMYNLPTMITPYKKDGSVDIETALKYVDFYFESGMDGIFAICQSSEIFHLSLKERVDLNRAVYERAKELEKASGRSFTVVSSGHISNTHEEQVRELRAIYESRTDALILITNRLDPENMGDDVFIERCERLISELPDDARFGLYECPYPYKRLVTPKILKWCVSTGRFDFFKDTCCDAAQIAERCKILAGSGFKLLNANSQTLLESLRAGADGYCGIMCNFHPKLYTWLVKKFACDPRAEFVQSVLGAFAFTEATIPYPLSAKHHMTLRQIETESIARNAPGVKLTAYAKGCLAQMKYATDALEAYLEI